MLWAALAVTQESAWVSNAAPRLPPAALGRAMNQSRTPGPAAPGSTGWPASLAAAKYNTNYF